MPIRRLAIRSPGAFAAWLSDFVLRARAVMPDCPQSVRLGNHAYDLSIALIAITEPSQ